MNSAQALPSPKQSPTTLRDRTRDLHPGWFASVMGTGILAVATYNNPGGWEALAGAAHLLGTALAVLAYALGALLVGGYAVRWVRHASAAMADFRHPAKGAMHATLPGGLLVLAVMTSVVSPTLMPSSAAVPVISILALVGGVLAVVMGVAFGYLLITGETPAASVNGGWFIPPVVTIIIPMVLTPLAAQAGPGATGFLVAVGYAFYGMGFLLFLLTLGLIYDRLILHPLPPAALAPSMWIGLGPVGVAALAALALAKAGAPIWGQVADAVSMVTLIASTTIWGFGLFWLMLVAALLLRYRRNGTIPFHLGWWAFVFPLGAYTVASFTVARAWHSPILEGLGGLLYLGLVAAWIVVTVRTIAAVRSGSIWSS